MEQAALDELWPHLQPTAMDFDDPFNEFPLQWTFRLRWQAWDPVDPLNQPHQRGYMFGVTPHLTRDITPIGVIEIVLDTLHEHQRRDARQGIMGLGNNRVALPRPLGAYLNRWVRLRGHPPLELGANPTRSWFTWLGITFEH
jgi:hypothetical protein